MRFTKSITAQGNFFFRYRSSLPILLLILGYATYSLELYFDQKSTLSRAFDIYNFLCLIISLFGLSIRIGTVAFIPDHTSGRNTRKQKAAVLNTTGLYSQTRNPLYLGNFIIWLGIGLLTQNPWFVLIYMLAFVLFYERIIFVEERFLLNKFGKSYKRWTNKTPIFFPRFRKWKKSLFRFQPDKAFREKNGLIAIFFIFWLFVRTNELLRGESPWFLDFWSISLIISIFIYLLIRIRRFVLERG